MLRFVTFAAAFGLMLTLAADLYGFDYTLLDMDLEEANATFTRTDVYLWLLAPVVRDGILCLFFFTLAFKQKRNG